jgi:hypothetical protein
MPSDRWSNALPSSLFPANIGLEPPSANCDTDCANVLSTSTMMPAFAGFVQPPVLQTFEFRKSREPEWIITYV